MQVLIFNRPIKDCPLFFEATQHNPPVVSFGSRGTKDKGFVQPCNVAVSRRTGDIFVGIGNFIWAFTDEEFLQSIWNNILWLLIVSAGAAAVLLLGMWFLSQGGLSQTNANDGGQAVDAQAFQGDRAPPPAADAPTGPTGEARPAPTGETPNVTAPTQPSS